MLLWMLTVNVYIIVIYDEITVDYCKCILLYSPLNSYLYVHWILDFKQILLLLLLSFKCLSTTLFINLDKHLNEWMTDNILALKAIRR